jgi:hypothetical protein
MSFLYHLYFKTNNENYISQQGSIFSLKLYNNKYTKVPRRAKNFELLLDARNISLTRMSSSFILEKTKITTAVGLMVIDDKSYSGRSSLYLSGGTNIILPDTYKKKDYEFSIFVSNRSDNDVVLYAQEKLPFCLISPTLEKFTFNIKL